MRSLLILPLFLLLVTTSYSQALQQPDDSVYDVSANPINSDTNEITRRVFSYLADNFGVNILSGQQDLTWNDTTDMLERVYDRVGYYPAIMGYDFMNYTNPNTDGGSGLQQTEEAIEYWNRGGLVAFCWHWRDPSRSSNAFYTEDTDFRINLDNPETREQLINDIDLIAGELKRLEEAGVPVLWRPLHESSGGWFWWGGSGPQPLIDLWILMYERMTNVHQLNNLIWVFNGQNPNWYPGDEYVDIISEDVYANVSDTNGPDYSSQIARFMQAVNSTEERKIVALSENGTIPDPAQMISDNAMWSWFMTWNDNPNLQNEQNNFFSGAYHNSHDHKQHVFNHPRVLNLEDLPDFSMYPIRN